MYAEYIVSKIEYELNLENGQAETLAWREERIVETIRELSKKVDNSTIVIEAARRNLALGRTVNKIPLYKAAKAAEELLWSFQNEKNNEPMRKSRVLA